MQYKRIISIVPSQTELLYSLGLNTEVVGITKFCIHPQDWFKTKTRVGGTKKINLDMVQSLQPDLIIANKEENTLADVIALEKMAPVIVTDISTLDEALHMITSIGDITQTQARANEINAGIQKAFEQLDNFIKPNQPGQLSVCYLIWQNPYMTVGNDTFIHHMLRLCGFKNVFESSARYPAITIEEIIKAGPDVILLSSEPFPFKEKHIAELQQHLPSSYITLANGEMFSWYGSRLLQAPDYFMSLLKSIHNIVKSNGDV